MRRQMPMLIVPIAVAVAIAGCGGSPSSNPAPNPGSALSASQTGAAGAAAAATKTIVQAVSVAPPAFVSQVSERQEEVRCPVVEFGLAGQAVTLKLDYGQGCNPRAFPHSMFAGSVAGSIDFDGMTLSYDFDTLTINGDSVDGTMSAALTQEDNTLNLATFVDLTGSSFGAVGGEADVTLDSDTGVTSIHTATLSVDPLADDAVTVDFAEVIVDPADNPDLLPHSGTASFELPNDGAGPETISFVITFLATTPHDRIVNVTVAGSDPIPYTLPQQ